MAFSRLTFHYVSLKQFLAKLPNAALFYLQTNYCYKLLIIHLHNILISLNLLGAEVYRDQ